MDLIKVYRKNIVESKGFVFISLLFAIAIRLLFHYNTASPTPTAKEEYAYLHQFVFQYLGLSDIVSLILGFVTMLGIVFYVEHLNRKYALIRCRTNLIYALIPLLLSGHPDLIYMNCQYLSIFALLISINIIYDSYQQKRSAAHAYKIGFILAAFSLLSFYILTYILLCWIGLAFMRSLNFKSFIASILGIITIYWLAFCIFAWQGSIAYFIEPFTHLLPAIETYNLNDIDIYLVAIGAANVILLIAIMTSNQVNSFMDKIRIRENFSFLNILTIVSLLSYLFIVYDPLLYLCVSLTISSIILTRFFAPDIQKYKVYMFLFFILLYLLNCLYNLIGYQI